MTQRWMPIMGEFDTASDPLVFKGHLVPAPPSGDPQTIPLPETASVGILLSNQKMANGRLCATVKFPQVTMHSVAELIVSYDPHTQGMITTGLGGGAMFSIREWVPAAIPQTQGRWVHHQAVITKSEQEPLHRWS
jgi:hypothetical protein